MSDNDNTNVPSDDRDGALGGPVENPLKEGEWDPKGIDTDLGDGEVPADADLDPEKTE